MRKASISGAAVLILVILAASVTPSWAQSDSVDDRLREALRKMTVDLRGAQDNQAALQAQLDQAQKQRDLLQQQVATLNARLAQQPATAAAQPAQTVQPAASPAEIQQLTTTLEGFHAQVAAQAPPEVRDDALAQATALEEAVGDGDLSRLKQAARWLARNAPRVGEAVASLVLTPIVGRLVGVAGDALVAELGLRPAAADDAGQRSPD